MPVQRPTWDRTAPPVRTVPQPPPTAPPPPSSTATSWWIAAGVVIVALAVAAGILVGLSLAQRGSSGAAGATCGGHAALRLTTTADFAPLVEAAADDIGAERSGCKLVQVTAQTPAATLTELPQHKLDAWVPPSSAWLRLAVSKPASPSSLEVEPTTSPPAPAGLFAKDAPVSLARSPVVLAGAKPLPATWAAVAAGVNSKQIPTLSMDSPLRDTAALLAVLGLQSAMAKTTVDPGIAQMRALSVRARLSDADLPPATSTERMAKQTDPAKAMREVGVFPLLESDLWRYQQGQHAVPLNATYPADGLLEADFPLAPTAEAAANKELKALVTRLADRMRSPEFAGTLAKAGLRSADSRSTGTPSGLAAQYPQPAPLPDKIAESAAMWAQYKKLAYHTLLLVDASASMNDQVRDRSGAVTTKAGLLRAAGVQAAQLFGDETSLGVWMFASPGGAAAPYTVALPFGPMAEPVAGVARRDAMRLVAQNYKAMPAAGTPLFETVLRGVGDMKQHYEKDAVTMVVVLTDGRDQDSRFSMPREQFLSKLNTLRDPARPVAVFAIGYGADADMTVLSEMAQRTGGRAVPSNDPGDLASAMAKIFLAAHAPH